MKVVHGFKEPRIILPRAPAGPGGQGMAAAAPALARPPTYL